MLQSWPSCLGQAQGPASGQGQQEQAACSAGAVTSVPFLLHVVGENEVPEQPALVPKGLQE